MEDKRYDKRRREAARRRRQRQVRRQIAVIGAGVLVTSVLLIGAGAAAYRNSAEEKQQAEREAKLKAALESCYGTFLASRGSTAKAAAMQTEEEEFASWLMREYPKVSRGELLDQAQNGELTEADVYEELGKTMQVLSDQRKGYLDDEKTAAEQGIYLKDGTESGHAQVTIAGDLCFAEDGFVLDHYDEVGELSKCISPEILELTNASDVFYLNHEYCISDRGEALEGKLYTFRAKPERMKLLQEMGTDLVSLANNHVYDYGEDALLDTLSALKEEEIPYVGGGIDAKEAKRPVYYIVNGMKIGFVAATNAEIVYYTPAATETSPGVLEAYDTTEYKELIGEASKECDYLIAYIHWGPEDTTQFADYQKTQGSEFLAAGADIVVGGHPHVLQGIEYVEEKPIVYSMGDFWFNDETKYTGLLQLDLTPKGLEKLSFVPCQQTGYETHYLSEETQRREMFDFLQGLSPNAVIDDEGVITEAPGGNNDAV